MKQRSLTAIGAYELTEWSIDGDVLSPPSVRGRLLIVDGTISTILCNHAHADKRMTIVLLGTYMLNETDLDYEYQQTSTFIETPRGVSASTKPLWEGGRSFTVETTETEVRFTSKKGCQMFSFTRSGLAYSEDGRTLRVWRRPP